jgi:hypothetical protein
LNRADKKKNEMKLATQREMWGSRKMNRGVWRGILQERNHLQGVGIDGRIILKQAL